MGQMGESKLPESRYLPQKIMISKCSANKYLQSYIWPVILYTLVRARTPSSRENEFEYEYYRAVQSK